ncbi:MAG: SpoIID/LytB domain-containing protein, partial [Clostridiales bacterium]|nr:SpoIID/LytB domain-containing protein [Clostridiales bacterium]
MNKNRETWKKSWILDLNRMRHSKIAERFLTIVEILLLAAIVLLSLYLIYGYILQGESAESVDAVISDEFSDGTDAMDLEGSADDPAQSILEETSADESTLVRVQILDNDYSASLFDVITVSCGAGLLVERGTYADDYAFLPGMETSDDGSFRVGAEGSEISDRDEVVCSSEGVGETAVKAGADGELRVSADDLREGEALRLTACDDGTLTVTSLQRADGSPAYEGELYIYRMDGGLALVNVLTLRKYLYGVVASEMPSGYPTEALKAQAVCARTYALQCLENHKKEKKIADLDDSVRFQVYNNYHAADSSREAVDQTDGEILLVDNVQYYSTSCLSEKRDDLGEEQAFREFLMEAVEEEAEYGSVWIRWYCEISAAEILEKLETQYDICAESLDEVEVVSRGGNGQAQLLRVTAGGESVEIAGEYAIRQFLSSEKMEVTRSDQTTVTGMQALPSAFFYVDLLETRGTDTTGTDAAEIEDAGADTT